MARIQITGSQVKNSTIVNAHIVDATIAEAKLADGAKYLRHDTARAWTVDQDGGAKKLTNIAAGTSPNDAVTYQQLQDNSAGLDPKQSVRVATTAAITLSGTQTIDGVTLVAGDRVLVKNQATLKDNGIYVVAAGAWARASDSDGTPANEVSGGNYTYAEQGTVNAGTGWVLVADGDIVVDTDDQVWTQFSGAGLITAGYGLVKNGNTIDVQITDGLQLTGAGTDYIGLKLDGTTLSVSGSGVKLADLAEAKVLIGSAGSVATAQSISGDVALAADGTVTIQTGAVENGMLAGAIDPGKVTVASANIIVGNASNVGAAVAVTGDVTINNTGVTAIGEGKVTNAMLAGSIAAGKITVTDGSFIVGTTGDVGAVVAMSGDVTMTNAGVTAIGSNKVTNDMLAGSIAAGKVALTDGYIIAGNGSNVGAAVQLSGDVTMTNAGVTAIGDGKVTNSMLAGSIAAGKLTVASANIIVGNGSDVGAVVAMSGDVAIDNTGATTIQTGAVENSMLAGSIAAGKLSLAENKIIVGNGSGVGSEGLTFVATPNWSSITNSDIVSGSAIKAYLASAASFIDEEVPTGNINGVNVEFTLANTPVSGSVVLFLNGQRLRGGAGNDWTITGSTVTMAYAPDSGDTLIAAYRQSV